MANLLMGGVPAEIGEWLKHKLQGLNVVTCATGAEFLDRFHGQPFDLILLDHGLQNPTALEVLVEIRKGPPTPLFYSLEANYQDPSLLHKLVDEYEVRQILLHPFDPDELIKRISGALSLASQDTRSSAQASQDKLWERYKPTNLARVATLQETARYLFEGRLTSDQRQLAQREAHKLSGALGTFGFPQGSKIAGQMELILEANVPLDEPTLLRFSALAVELNNVVNGVAERVEELPDGNGQGRPILQIGPPNENVAWKDQALRHGFRIEHCRDLESAHSVMPKLQPHACLVYELLSDWKGSIASLCRSYPDVPIIVSVPEPLDRVTIAQEGARAFIRPDLDPTRYWETVAALTRSTQASVPSVLLVEDEPVQRAYYTGWLESEGMKVTSVDNPLEFWNTFKSTRVDIIILDVDMPYISGIDLCRSLRNDPQYHGIPVMFLTATLDVLTLRRMFAAGGDDYMGKPIAGPEMAVRVRSRLERTQMASPRYADRGLTHSFGGDGVWRLEPWLSLAEHAGEPFSLAVLGLDQVNQLVAELGRPPLASLVDDLEEQIRALRPGSGLARLSPVSFALALPGLEANQAREWLNSMSKGLHLPTVGGERPLLSAGLAEYKGQTLDALIEQASEARSENPGKVTVAQVGDATAVSELDVVVVEDDESLAALLLHALSTRGHRARWFAEGGSAAQFLTQSEGLPKVVLMDVDLPGASGLEVLKRMGQARSLEKARVIMLTARSTEKEILGAFELGAFDHISKPFSLAVLMQKLRRALEA